MAMNGSAHKDVVDVVVVGAGPYGLSIAAHLRSRGVEVRIFGEPMSTWSTQMPKGMRLKSEGFASSLSEPDTNFTLGKYCKEAGLPYADLGLPVPIATFIGYGVEFQKRFVPHLERKMVDSVRRAPAGFEVRLETGELVQAKRLVLATGICHFGYVPPVLAGLPIELVTHSSHHSDLSQFRGRDVGVIGAGASALDLAALLRHAGSKPQLIARTKVIRFQDPPTGRPRSLWQRIKLPMTGIGSGWKLLFYTNAPHIFHLLPESIRLAVVRKTLGPAPGWFVKEDCPGKMPFHLGFEVAQAKIEVGKVVLKLRDVGGQERKIEFDHVIAATGYKVDLRHLKFLDEELLAKIETFQGAPKLSLTFESSVPELYFVGTAAAYSFGPLMRFAYGAEFVARRLSKHLARLRLPSRARAQVELDVQVLDREEVGTQLSCRIASGTDSHEN